MTRHLITLPRISIQSFDLLADGRADKRKGATGEAARPKGEAMRSVHTNPQNSNGSAVFQTMKTVDPLSVLVDQSAVTLTAEQAGGILRRCRYDRQTRDLKPAGRAHVEVLADIMRRRQWRPLDQIAFARLDEKLILVNGHHRMAAQEKSGQEIDWLVVIHECEDSSEVARLYYTFDTNQRGRSNETILSALNAAEILGISKTTAEALYRAAPLLIANFDFSRSAQDHVSNRVVDRRMEVMKSYAAEAAAWEAATRNAPQAVRRKLRNQGAFAVALLAFRHRPVEAERFFVGLAENDGLRKGDPRHTYLSALLTNNSSGTGAFTARQAAVAWNAWAQGRSLLIIKIVESNTFRIVGTPVGR